MSYISILRQLILTTAHRAFNIWPKVVPYMPITGYRHNPPSPLTNPIAPHQSRLGLWFLPWIWCLCHTWDYGDMSRRWQTALRGGGWLCPMTIPHVAKPTCWCYPLKSISNVLLTNSVHWEFITLWFVQSELSELQCSSSYSLGSVAAWKPCDDKLSKTFSCVATLCLKPSMTLFELFMLACVAPIVCTDYIQVCVRKRDQLNHIKLVSFTRRPN